MQMNDNKYDDGDIPGRMNIQDFLNTWHECKFENR